MAKLQQRAPVPGPAFIRQLARLVQTEPAPSTQTLSERLSHWIDWNRAVNLSRALDAPPVGSETMEAASGNEEFEACQRSRAALMDTITGFVVPQDDRKIEFALFRKHCLDVQRSMQTATGRLRGRLRERVAAQSAALARLAEVDAVMEMTLSPREQSLLARVPALLETHFAALTGTAEGDSTPSRNAGLETFRRDMQDLLLAELEVRFLPIDSLLAALRTPTR